MHRRGFSLIELAVVLAIIAVAAAAVAVRIQGPMARAGMRDVVSALGHFDRMTRAAAREQDRSIQVLVDLDAGQLSRQGADGKAIGNAGMGLPDGFRIRRLLLGRREITDGRATIACSRRGLTPAYAMQVEGRGAKQWIVVAGMTEELDWVDDEAEVRKIMEATGPRPNAG